MPNIASNIKSIIARISSAAEASGRNADGITLLAVSKTQPASSIRQAVEAGLTSFGENYLQEALEKMDELRDLELDWHFIGPIQSNKTRAVASNFNWVHSVDREKIGRRLSDQRPAHMKPLNICLQVNLDDENTKSGITPDDLPTLAQSLCRLPNLRLRGLMAIPKATDSYEEQRNGFFRLRQLLDNLRHLDPALETLDTLSMGMSGDMEAAIAEGATIVRVGTAIFGARK
jgi:hypothetical protein